MQDKASIPKKDALIELQKKAVDDQFKKIQNLIEDEWLKNKYINILKQEIDTLPAKSTHASDTAEALFYLVKAYVSWKHPKNHEPAHQGGSSTFRSDLLINDPKEAFEYALENFLTCSQNPGFSPRLRIAGAGIASGLLFGLVGVPLMLAIILPMTAPGVAIWLLSACLPLLFLGGGVSLGAKLEEKKLGDVLDAQKAGHEVYTFFKENKDNLETTNKNNNLPQNTVN